MLNITLRPSRWLTMWIVAWAIVLLWPAWLSSLPIWWCLLIDLGILVWMVLALRRHRWSGERHLSYGDGCWQLDYKGQQQTVTLDGEFYANLWLIVLVFRTENRQKIVQVILPDSADHNDRRRLRVLLKQLPVDALA